jgi:ABC-type bacteriocin/lantibiotic exporter with double-glycine peptidase domain
MSNKELPVPVIGWLRAGWRADTGDSRLTAPMRISRSVEYSVPVADHAAASARIAELEHEAQQLSALVQALDAKAAELEQQLEQARKDQARYQILRRGQHWSVINGIGDTLRAEALDAAIDAALASQGTAQEVGK